jgi:BCD family chlorophyll transporter-like MFS transporter
MIVELGVPAWWVALSVALPLVFAPLRALIGYRSDTHPSALGLKRLPYLWIGNILLFGGLSIMPFALLALSEPDADSIIWVGRVGAGLAFLLVGAGMQITQTAGLALATDISPVEKRPRVVALLHSMLLVGLILGSGLLGIALTEFSSVRLIQVVQGCAVLVAALNLASLWKQEARSVKRGAREQGGFSRNWHRLMQIKNMKRFLWTVGLGSCAFSMQDIILEPFGGEVLHLDVSFTSSLTAISALGALIAFMLSAKMLSKGLDACRVAAIGVLVGLPGFASVVFSSPLESATLFRVGAALIGFGGGLFSVGMLITAMETPEKSYIGMVLGAWGGVQATSSGLSMAIGGALRDLVSRLAEQGILGPSLNNAATGYSFVFHLEIFLLFVVLIAMAPLAKKASANSPSQMGANFGLAELPN